MSEITDAEIQEVLEYCEKATEGPWFWKQDYELGDSEHWELANPESDAEGKTIDASLILNHDSPTWFNQPCAELPNWVFITRARTDLPRLARALQEARRKIEELERTIQVLSPM